MACTRADFLSLGACFSQKNFSVHDQQAIMVLRLALISDSVATTTYASALTTTLLTDSNDATCGMTDDQISAALLGVLWQGVAASFVLFTGTAIPAFGDAPNAPNYATKNLIADAIKCLKNVTDRQLKTMQLFLICKIWSGWQAGS